VTHRDRARELAQRSVHGQRKDSRLAEGLTADERRVVRREAARATRRENSAPASVSRPLRPWHEPIPAQAHEVTLAKRKARKGRAS
jgi:hypothetical protein